MYIHYCVCVYCIYVYICVCIHSKYCTISIYSIAQTYMSVQLGLSRDHLCIGLIKQEVQKKIAYELEKHTNTQFVHNLQTELSGLFKYCPSFLCIKTYILINVQYVDIYGDSKITIVNTEMRHVYCLKLGDKLYTVHSNIKIIGRAIV